MEQSAKISGRLLSEVARTPESRSAHVRSVFEDPLHYLSQRGGDILFRRAAVRTYAGQFPWKSLLDIGCGDGSISLGLLEPGKELTLLDLSEGMTRLARQNVPKTLADHVIVRNENFMTAKLDSADLIVTVGVLAHVDSLDAFLAKVQATLRPGGHLILEFTDCRHAVGQVGRFFDRLKEFVAPARYPTNKLSRDQVFPLFDTHHLELLSTFRYSRLPLPILGRLIPSYLQYRLGRLIFGDAQKNTRASLGNEYICLLQARP